MHNGFLRFTSGATPTNLLPTYFFQVVVEFEPIDTASGRLSNRQSFRGSVKQKAANTVNKNFRFTFDFRTSVSEP